MTARRRFFKKMSAYAALVGGSVMLSACDKKTEKASPPKIDSADHQRQLLDAYVDTIVPEDQSPGAVAAGVPAILIAKLDRNIDERNNVTLLLATLDLLARKTFRLSFISLNLAQRESVIKRLTHSRDKNDGAAQQVLGQQRSRIIRAFYQSEAGREMLGYRPPYPAGYPDFNKPPPA